MTTSTQVNEVQSNRGILLNRVFAREVSFLLPVQYI